MAAPRRIALLEPLTGLALAAHGAAVALVADPSWQVVSASAVLAGLGLAGAAGWRSPAAVALRGVVATSLAFTLLVLDLPGSGYFLLWFFVVAAVYPLVLPLVGSRVLVAAVPLAYLALTPLGAPDGPLAVEALRSASLLLVGVVAHTAATAFRDAVEQRDDSTALLEAYLDAAPVGFALWDPGLVLRRADERLADALGVAPESMLGTSVDALPVSPALARAVHQVLATGEPVGALELTREDRVWSVELFGVDVGQRRRGVGCVAVDVTEAREAEAALTHLATHDTLTHLPNRTLFADRLAVALAQARRTGAHVAVLFCDLDHFKVVNDSLGHDVGDALLLATAGRLRESVRAGDTVARLGGDEFAVLCADVADAREAVAIGRRACEALRLPLPVETGEVTTTLSVGVAVTSGADRDPATLLRDADVALYQAKGGGRDQVALFDDRSRAVVTERLAISEALRRAVERSEITVAYQPVLAAAVDGGPGAVGRVLGFEALARWTRDPGGPVPPGVFVPVAEDLGLIGRLGSHVLATACAQAAAWRAETGADLFVGVNVSARQLEDPRLLEEVSAVLRRTRLDPHALHLEITESVLMRDMTRTVTVLNAVRELGVTVAVDDFGTGYSSLAYLRDLPVDVLKIDRSFTSRLPEGDLLFAQMIRIAEAIGATTVVEGVETAEQLAAATTAGARAFQGFLLGRPAAAAQARAFLDGV